MSPGSTGVEVHDVHDVQYVPDVCIPTSQHLDGSDAMPPAPDAHAAVRAGPPVPVAAGARLSPRVVPESAAAHRYPDGPVWTARLEAVR